MPDRKVVFTEQFFDHLELLLPPERDLDGTPSVTDFLAFDLPTVRDELVRDYERRTTATDDADIRVYLGTGLPVRAFAIYVALDGDTIEAFWITVDRFDRPDH